MLVDNEDGTFGIKQSYTFVTPPKPVGFWQITPDVDGGWHTRIAVYRMPEQKHIDNIQEAFGWKWVEKKESEE
jgi:hypothetical protein